MRWILAMLALSLSGAAYGKNVTYKIDGQEYEGYAMKAKGKGKGLVIVIHDWDGLTDYEEKRVKMLSDSGYDAFAIDLYGKGNRPVETDMKKAQTKKLYDDREAMRKRILAGLDQARQTLADEPAVVMGYCFGGAAVLELARSGKGKDIAGYATFHGGLQTPPGQKYTKSAPIFISHGGADTGIPMSDVAKLSEELEAAGITYEIEVYSGAPHAFTVFGSDRYQKKADEKSWDSFKNFLNFAFAGSSAS